MKEGQSEVFSEVPGNSVAQKTAQEPKPAQAVPETQPAPKTPAFAENASSTPLTESRVKISHAPNTKNERVDFSSDDILDSTLAGTRSDPFVNVREKKSLKDATEKARIEAKSRLEDLRAKNSQKAETALEKFTSIFQPPRLKITLSVLAAALLAVCLLIAPSLTKSAKTDPLAINPETGYTNRETEWDTFTNMVRTRVYELSEPDRTAPQDAVLTYFEELLEDYRGIAQHLDIRSLEAEYYLNLGLSSDAIVALESVDPAEYQQPASTDPDLPAYYERLLNYYDLLASAYSAAGYESLSEEASAKYRAVFAEHSKYYGFDLDEEE